MDKKIFGVTPNVFWLGLVSFFNDASNEMVKAVMPVFLTVTLGVSPAFVGFLDGFADAVASVLRIFSGWFSDRIGRRKRIVVAGYGLSLITRFFLLAVSSFWQVFALRAIDRVGKGVRESPRDALVAESVQGADLGRSFGFQRALDAAGGVAGPVGAVLLLPILIGDYKSLFLIASIIGLFAILCFVFVKDQRAPQEIIPKTPVHLTFSLHQFGRSFKLLLVSIFVFGLGMMPIGLVTLKTQAAGFSTEFVLIMYLVYTLSFSFFAVPFGRISDRFGKGRIIQLGFVTAIAAYIILSFTSNIWSIGFAFALLGMYSAMTDGIERAFASGLLQPHQLAAGHGFLQGAVGISSLIAGTVGGLIWTIVSPSAAFMYCSLLMLAGLFLFVFLKNRS